MKILLLFLVVLAAWHFIYEAILAPSLRMHLRNRLFALRDELRNARAAGIVESDQEAFWFVHNGVNAFLNKLPYLTIGNATKLSQAYDSDVKLRKTLDNHLSKVTAAQNLTIQSVFKRTNNVIRDAMVVNAGGWFIYIIPVVVLFATMTHISRFAKAILLTPRLDMERILPSHNGAHIY